MKPATIVFRDQADHEQFAHVDPHDGYVYAQDAGGMAYYFPWHRITRIQRAPEDQHPNPGETA